MNVQFSPSDGPVHTPNRTEGEPETSGPRDAPPDRAATSKELAQVSDEVHDIANTQEQLASSITSALDRLTASSQAVGKVWVQVPGVIGVIVVAIGLMLLFYAFVGAAGERFAPTLWGGVVLVGLGALSATASAIANAFAPPQKPGQGAPNMAPLGSRR